MAADYTPTNVTQGFGAETQINKNFTDIKTAIDKLLNRLVSGNNAMGQVLDMGANRLLNLPLAVFPTDPVLLSQLESLTVNEAVKTVTFANPMNVDTTATTLAKITLTDNTTITFTGTPSDGQPIMLALKQDAIGSRIVTWEARVRFSTDLPTAVLTTTASKLDYILMRYNKDDDKFDVQAINRGF